MTGKHALTVWHYSSVMGAAAGEVRLKDLRHHRAFTILDAVTVMWVRGAQKPRLSHMRHRNATCATHDTLLGAVLGGLFLPESRGDIGADLTRTRRLEALGLDQEILDRIRQPMSPGSSSLLVLSMDSDYDVIREFVERGLARGDATVMHAPLTDDASVVLTAVVNDLTRWRPG